jgi:hypothetical protein
MQPAKAGMCCYAQWGGGLVGICAPLNTALLEANPHWFKKVQINKSAEPRAQTLAARRSNSGSGPANPDQKSLKTSYNYNWHVQAKAGSTCECPW